MNRKYRLRSRIGCRRWFRRWFRCRYQTI